MDLTREQAVENLRVIQNKYTWSSGAIEVLNIAIQALMQEPCDDAISRTELLKAIDTWDKFGCDADTKLVPYKDHYIPYIHYDDVVKCIKGMPSVNPQEPKWDRLYSWLNDMRLGIAPDETVTDIDERNVRTAQVDLLDEIMEWMVEPQESEDKTK